MRAWLIVQRDTMHGKAALHESRNLKQARPFGQYVDLLRRKMRSLLPHSMNYITFWYACQGFFCKTTSAPQKLVRAFSLLILKKAKKSVTIFLLIRFSTRKGEEL